MVRKRNFAFSHFLIDDFVQKYKLYLSSRKN